ncbi:MAG TPA: Flp pilus assembly protein CpaB [bacterium]|nr:Flp pilus assembly protein CpaB [bacterium]
MKNKKFILALGIGALAGLVVFWVLMDQIQRVQKQTTPVSVLVATTFIPAQSVLRADEVEKREIPGAYISPSAIQDLRESEGLVTLVPISAGEQVLSNKLGLPDNNLAITLPKGFRAFTLEVNEITGVGGLLNPGNRVDVLAHLETNQKQITATVLQDVQVLATGSQTNPIPAAPNGAAPSAGTAGAYQTVTLAVTPQQAEMLAFLEERHPLRLILRPPGDEETLSLPPQSDSDWLAKIGSFSRQPGKSLEVIRGAQNDQTGQ